MGIWILKWKGFIIEILDEIKHGIHISFDYFKCSFPLIVRKEELSLAEVKRLKIEIAKFFNVAEEEITPAYIPKYSDSYCLGENIILATGGPEFGNGFKSCYLELKGKGCREYEVRCPNKDWKDLLIYFALNMESQIKRIDIAIDDYDGNVVDFDWIINKLNNGFFVSSFNNKNFNTSGHINTGRSITFGKHGSPLMLCIYEKLKEQQAKGIECNQEYWTRYEMRFAQSRANDFAYNFLKNTDIEFKDYIMSIFYNMLDIKKDNDRNQHHMTDVPTDPKWLEFLGKVEKYKMVRASSIEGSYITYENWAKPLMSGYFLYLIFTNNKEIYSAETKMFEDMLEYLDSFDKKKLKHINSFLLNKRHPLIALKDIEAFKVFLKDYIEERKLPF